MGKIAVLVALRASASQHVACLRSWSFLVPTSIPLNSPTVQLEILRYPGATFATLTDKLSDLDFWTRRYDDIILCIGGNDLARLSVDEVFDRLCDLCRRQLSDHVPYCLYCRI